MKLFASVFFILFSFSIFAQTKSDTLVTKEKTHSVKLATLLSTALPGAGQVYNHIAMPKGHKKAYWKVPLIYAALGTSVYFLVKNQQKMNVYKNEYVNRVRYNITSPSLAQYDLGAIQTLHDEYQRRRDLTILAVVGVYALNVLDAAIEAHFVSFDVSKDLSIRVRPKIMIGYRPGIAVSFNFR